MNKHLNIVMCLLFHFLHSTTGTLIYIWSVCILCLYRSFATNFLLTVPVSYTGSGIFETWCRLVNKDSLLVLKQITFTLLLAFHRSARNVPCISPPNHTICMHAPVFTLDTPFIRTNDNPISYRLFA
jgi:hypothetical protein